MVEAGVILAEVLWALVHSLGWVDSDLARGLMVVVPDVAHPVTMRKINSLSSNRNTNSNKRVVPLKKLSRWEEDIRVILLPGRGCMMMCLSLIWEAAWDEELLVEGEGEIEAVRRQPQDHKPRHLRTRRLGQRMLGSLVLIIAVEVAGEDIGASTLMLGMVERRRYV